MKKSIRFILAALLIISSVVTMAAKTTYTDKQKEKIRKECVKEAKKLAKQYKKEGWKMEQAGLMENVIADFLYQTRAEGLKQRVGSSEAKKTRSMCRKQIEIDVPNAYAKEQSQIIKGKIINEDRSKDGYETEDFIADYETRLAMEIAGDLRVGYTLYKKNPDGTYDMMSYFLVDPDTAHAAKLRAAKHAAQLHKLDREWMDSISKTINDQEDED